MDLEKTLIFVHQIFDQKEIDHALIGGIALACLGINRTTYDVDMIIDKNDKDLAISSLITMGFNLDYESEEVCQFSGIGYLDLLLAQRPIGRQMLKDATIQNRIKEIKGLKCLQIEDIIGLKIQAYKNDSDREFQDKSDIVALIKIYPNLDWDKIKKYAELFTEWEFLKKIGNR